MFLVRNAFVALMDITSIWTSYVIAKPSRPEAPGTGLARRDARSENVVDNVSQWKFS